MSPPPVDSHPEPLPETPPPRPGGVPWRFERTAHSLPEVYGSIAVPTTASFWKKLLAFAGPGYLVAVGYMDPGNWATDIAGGARYGYALLSMIMVSNLMAIVLQALSARLGIASGRDLAQACRDAYSRPVTIVLWVLCEIAIAACDLAEVLGAAIALHLLFGIPLIFGVCLTALDVLIVLSMQHRGFRWVEGLVVLLILGIAGCFAVELWFTQPNLVDVARGFVPSSEIARNPDMLYIAIGILGATVMPHNLYLHSSIVQTRKYTDDEASRKEAIRFSTIDSTIAFDDAYKLLSPLLGTTMASVLFATALLLSGQNATLTGTLAGQIVMEGFLSIRLRPWLRRLITRLIAIVPAIGVLVIYGDRGTGPLLLLSQVILSLQLPFAVFPLVVFTGDRAKMGNFAAPLWLRAIAWPMAVFIAALNAWLLWQTLTGGS